MFPSYPSYLNPKPQQKRKTLNSSTDEKPLCKKAKYDNPTASTKKVNKIPKTKTKTHKKKTLKMSPTKTQLKSKIKSLQQKLRRKDKKLKSIKDLFNALQQKRLLDSKTAEFLENHFSGLTSEIFKNAMRNCKRMSQGRRYNDKSKQFALTLNFYSPRAYNFLRKLLYLPNPSSIREWTTSVNCEPGFLIEVFKDLNNKIQKSPKMADCCLIIDAMAIRKQINFDKKKFKIYRFC